MKNWVKKIQEFFSRPKVIKWTIAILTLLIVVGAIKILVWTIYTKDQPDFVPEKVREDIQGAIKESGEAIKKVSKPIGTAIVNSAHQEPETEKEDSTAGWPIYKDLNTGISMKYPIGWEVFQGEEGVFSFSPSEDSNDGITIYYSQEFSRVEDYWADYINDWDSVILGPEVLHEGENIFYKYAQQDGLQEIHYLIKINNFIYDLMPNGTGNNYVEEILATLN